MRVLSICKLSGRKTVRRVYTAAAAMRPFSKNWTSGVHHPSYVSLGCLGPLQIFVERHPSRALWCFDVKLVVAMDTHFRYCIPDMNLISEISEIWSLQHARAHNGAL